MEYFWKGKSRMSEIVAYKPGTPFAGEGRFV
jgi:hypothetical protein